MLLAVFYAARHNLCFSIICKPGLGCPCPVSYLRGLALHCLFPSISGWMSGALSHTLCVPRYLFASSFLCFLYPSAHSSFPCRTKDSYWFSPSPKKTSSYYGLCWLLYVQRYLPVTVALFRAFRTDLSGYHTFLSLHPSAAFTAYDSV